MLSSPLLHVISFLLLSSIIEAFLSTPPAASVASSQGRRRTTQSLVRITPTPTTVYGSLRDLVDDSTEGEEEDVTMNTKSNNNRGSSSGGGARSDNFSGLINYSRSKFSDTKFRSRSVYGTGYYSGKEEQEELLGLNVDRLSPFSFSTSGVPKSQSQGGGLYDVNVMEKLDKALPPTTRTSSSSIAIGSDDSNVNVVDDRCGR